MWARRSSQQLNPERWGHPDVRPAVMGTFIAGMDTAANSLAFVLYRMHRHPESLPALRAEVDALFRAGPPTAEALGRSPLLHRFVMETMRIHPIAPALSRTLTEDVDFAGVSPSCRHPCHHRHHRAARPVRAVPRPRALRPGLHSQSRALP